MRWKEEAHQWGRRRVQPQSPDKVSYESQRAAWEPGMACPASPAVGFRLPPWILVPSPACPNTPGRLTGLEQLDLDLWVPPPAPFPLDHSLCLEGCLSRHPLAHYLKSLLKHGLLLELPQPCPTLSITIQWSWSFTSYCLLSVSSREKSASREPGSNLSLIMQPKHLECQP